MKTLMLMFALLYSSWSYGEYDAVQVDRVVRVYDGDTFYVDVLSYPAIIGQNMPVRVAGVDTPELNGAKCAYEKVQALLAKDYVINTLASADQVWLADVERGSFFRLVARVMVDGKDLADLLIAEGLGKAYTDPNRRVWCE